MRFFLGEDVVIGEIAGRDEKAERDRLSWRDMLRGENLRRSIFCGVPWACEGYAVYGVGVFLPVLIMSLGLSRGEVGTIAHTASSVQLSAYINLFVAVGFALGLAVVRRSSHIRQQSLGFAAAAVGLLLLMLGNMMHLPRWMMIAGFVVFEIFLNAGPHLITFVLPAQIYPIADRGAGAGLAAAMGKAGAVVGVFTIPLVMKWGGVNLVLAVTLLLQIVGVLVTATLGRDILGERSRPWSFRRTISSEDDASTRESS